MLLRTLPNDLLVDIDPDVVAGHHGLLPADPHQSGLRQRLGALVLIDPGQELHGIRDLPDLVDVLHVELSAQDILDEFGGSLLA